MAWKLDVGQGWAGPVVAGGRLILFHRVEIDEVVVALDPATGKEQWKFAYRTRYRDDFGFDEMFSSDGITMPSVPTESCEIALPSTCRHIVPEL